MLPTLIHTDNSFLEKNADSARGKLLLLDGIYDMRTGTFTAGFDSSVLFFGRIPRPFPNVRDENLLAAITEVYEKLFVHPYTPEQLKQRVPEYVLLALATALGMEYRQRKLYIMLGKTSSGRGH